jgi:hypothetical protein
MRISISRSKVKERVYVLSSTQLSRLKELEKLLRVEDSDMVYMLTLSRLWASSSDESLICYLGIIR